jgi:hypothetical protein
MHPVSLDLEKTPVLTWRWRVSKVPEGANIRHKKTEDTAARVVVMFDYDPGRLGLAMRTAYTIAASRADGEYPPLFTLAYVWAADAEPGDIITSTYTDRIKFIVLQSGNAKAGQWVSERRHVLKDFHAAFGDQEPTPIEGLGVMTDTDDLKDDVTASYDDFMFLPAGPEDTPAR